MTLAREAQRRERTPLGQPRHGLPPTPTHPPSFATAYTTLPVVSVSSRDAPRLTPLVAAFGDAQFRLHLVSRTGVCLCLGCTKGRLPVPWLSDTAAHAPPCQPKSLYRTRNGESQPSSRRGLVWVVVVGAAAALTSTSTNGRNGGRASPAAGGETLTLPPASRSTPRPRFPSPRQLGAGRASLAKSQGLHNRLCRNR